MTKESRTKLEQKIDEIIENARKISNTFILETAKLIKSELSRNKYSEKPISELEVLQQMAKTRVKAIAIYDKAGRDDLAIKETRELGYIQGIIPKEPSEQEIEKFISMLMKVGPLTIKDTKKVILMVQEEFPTAQKGTIARIFKSLL
nr:MAG TPA: YqeY-like protein [Crassvirales sp.]